MPIQLLAPQLINQIAAGEIVERPASVVKELLENSLDAGSTRIELDIEHGGIKCIRIRDNGFGIPKSELALALARHATSKIATLEDLERILSLGFRGEALASISSISRLTLTSSTGAQEGAWLVYAEGREMSVVIKPASHPKGTTIEVLDLFFNTPARRHFLKTERTEFAHIDEVVRKIALARYDVEVILKHNGKVIRHYKTINHLDELPRRITAISGKLFLQSGIQLSWQHSEFALEGWILDPEACSAQLDIQYCYVNGRITKDKLLMHAIRQAYQECMGEAHPCYILYLTLPADKVDVNVHPTKQEVRFHESRLVHDFVYQAILQALTTHTTDIEAVSSSAQMSNDDRRIIEPPIVVQELNDKWQDFRQQYHQKSLTNEQQQVKQLYQKMAIQPNESEKFTTYSNEPIKSRPLQKLFPIRDKHLIFSPDQPSIIEKKWEQGINFSEGLPSYQAVAPLGRVLMIYREKYAVIEHFQHLKILDLVYAEYCLKIFQLQQQIEKMQQETLLLPLSWQMTPIELIGYTNQSAYNGLQSLAITCTVSKNKISVNKVPLLLRRCPLQSLVSGLLTHYSTQLELKNDVVLQYLINLLEGKQQWTQSEAIQLVAQLELQSMDDNSAKIQQLLMNIDLEPIIKQLSYDTK